MSVDVAKDGNNWYVYCGNNPLKFVDPNGLDYIKPDFFMGGDVHIQIELFLMANYGGKREFYIPGANSNLLGLLGSKRVDYVLKNRTPGAAEFFEIKPISSIHNVYGDIQLESYVLQARRRQLDNERFAIKLPETPYKGTSILSELNGLSIPAIVQDMWLQIYSVNIQLITDPITHPGMIYYKLDGKKLGELTEEDIALISTLSAAVIAALCGMPPETIPAIP